MKQSSELIDNLNKKIYHTPLLMEIGSVFDITKGGDEGQDDGGTFTLDPPSTGT